MPDVKGLLRRITNKEERSTATASTPRRTPTWPLFENNKIDKIKSPPILSDCDPIMSRLTLPHGIKTRVLIISDTHSTPLLREDEDHDLPFKEPLPSADVLIHCGDLTQVGGMDEYHKTLDMLAKIDAPVKLVIAGNHDRTLDKAWMKRNMHKGDWTESECRAKWEEAIQLWYGKDGRAVKEGVQMLDEGVHKIELKNGALLTLYASPYQPEFCGWAFAYDLDEDRFNPRQTSLIGAKSIAGTPIPSFVDIPIDIIATHGPPYANLDRTRRGDLVGCPHLLRALMRSRPLIHCFGHIHEGWGAQRIAWGHNADDVATKSTVIKEFKKHWADEIADEGITSITVDKKTAKSKRCIEYNGTRTSAHPLQRGKETLLVNAAIMDVDYKPVNAPWLVCVDLPEKSKSGLQEQKRPHMGTCEESEET